MDTGLLSWLKGGKPGPAAGKVKEDIMYQYDVTFKETGELPWTIRLNNFRMAIFHANRAYSAAKERYRKVTDRQGRPGSSGQAGQTVLMQDKARLGNGNNPVIDSGGVAPVSLRVIMGGPFFIDGSRIDSRSVGRISRPGVNY